MSDNVVHALAGAGGGIISMALTYPLNTISLRSAVQKSATKQGVLAQVAAVKSIIAKEGVEGLYSGIHSALFGIAVTQGVYYFFYEKVKSTLEKITQNENISVLESISAGALAGAATVIITNPIWVINTRQTVKKQSLDDEKKGDQENTKKDLTFLETVLKIFKEDGLPGFYRGLVPALILVINPIIQYTVFEQLKVYLQNRKKALNGFDFFLLGAISKLAATGVTYPYLVVKSRMQLKQGETSDTKYDSVADGFKKILATEGIKGLYKGIESKLVQSVLTAAFMFAFKESLFEKTVYLLALLKLRERASAST